MFSVRAVGMSLVMAASVFAIQTVAAKVNAAEAPAAGDGLRKPLAEGLPPLPDPARGKRPWHSKLELRDGMMLRDGEPFFPIGYVFGESDDALAQEAAMGCNAVHYDIGWNVSQGPGPVPEAQFAAFRQKIRNSAQWGLAVFPLMTAHYVPAWFEKKYPRNDFSPLGSDGKPSGSWSPYSLSFQPMRDAMADFWKSVAPVLAAEPNVMAIELWNEPCYGGTWNRPDQFADYRPWTIENYRRALKEKYGSIEGLRKAHGQPYASFDAVTPPRLPDELGRTAWLDWMRFDQKTFADFFMWERQVVLSAAPAARLANKKQANLFDRSAASSATNWVLMNESEDIFGLDIYGGPMSDRTFLEAARSYAGGKPVIVFETNAMPPNAAANSGACASVALDADSRWRRGMFIFALIHDREHGLLSDAAVSAQVRPEYVEFTQSVGRLQRELASPVVPARIAVLYSTTAALQNPGDLIGRSTAAAFDMIKDSHYQVDFLPEERCTDLGLSSYQLLVLPSNCILVPEGIQAVDRWTSKGGKVLAFGHSLDRDESNAPISPPAFLGLASRKPAFGDRTHQTIETVSSAIGRYFDVPVKVSGVEMVTELANTKRELVPGAGIDVVNSGQVLAYNSDSYPIIVSHAGGPVVYCAFDSDSDPGLRLLIGGIVRDVLGIPQEVRLLDGERVASDVLTSLRQDWKDARIRYLMVVNMLPRPMELKVDLESGWRITGEKLHGAASLPGGDGRRVHLGASDVALFVLAH